MSDQEINISIAEACGWRLIFKTKIRQYGRPPWKIDGCRERIPDYCNDLNAMHEAESTLDTLVGRLKFPEILAQVISRYEGFRGNGLPLPEWHRTHATARQRAEAFLRTLGKWKD